MTEIKVNDKDKFYDEMCCNWYICPNCKNDDVAEGFSYCPDCGEKINWID